ncbi:Exocyst complex protein [Parasponia andersonii]|uniref:Exocyst subunit Exo70 family protein n=1 Tax=Parasponia andersonii TaxID=3476 RepID=A0A2P5D4J5_PARAD|nr:Exocyst complex protein [Parasponia andersonii]
MEDSKSAIPELEEEGQLIAAAKHIAHTIRSNKNLADEARRVLADLATQLSFFTSFNQREDENIDEARKLTEKLDSLPLNEEDGYDKKMELQWRAHDFLSKSHYSVDSLDYLASSGHDPVYRDCLNRHSEEILDFVHADVIPKLKSIATLMFNSKFDQQCTQDYTSARKNACDECLIILQAGNLSIEEVRGMDWTRLNAKIKRWIHAVQFFVGASKTSMIQLLDFGESISVGPTKPERLFRILDMYEVLAALLPDIEALYKGEAGSPIIIKSNVLLRKLGDFIKTALTTFKNGIASFNSTNSDQEEERDHSIASSSPDEENNEHSPLAHCFVSVAAVLEGSLDAKSKLYKKASLQHLFLINNIYYMALKVRASELRSDFGEKWTREHYWKCHQHALDYERASWGSVLSLLDVKGIQNSSSASTSKILWNERLRSFFLAFEEIYKTLTGWIIPDFELQEDLRISVSLNVILAYGTFVGRDSSQLSDKLIKYSADDLENYLF